ncbi:hypothetical protein Tco_1117626, partial [Tanacetum coccineum]
FPSNRVLADVGSLPRMFLGPQKVCHVRLTSSGPCQHGTGLSSGPSYFRLLWLGLEPIMIIRFRPRGLVLLDSGSGILRLPRPLVLSRRFYILVGVVDVVSSCPFNLPFYIIASIYPSYPLLAAKVSHFEILCRVHGCEPTVGLFRCFYVNSKNKGWMSFSRRPGSDAVCYTKPLDSLKGWKDHLFWVDAFAYPASFPWHTSKSVSNDPFPQSTEFNAEHYV